MNNIVWLASYPKSGNTWFRIFLTNLQSDRDEPADINRLERTPIASTRNIFDEAVGINAADLSHDEVDRLRPAVYRYLSDQAEDIRFLKIHDAYSYVDDCPDIPLIPADVTRGVVYMIRNPLDVAVSFAHHSHITIDHAIRRLANENACFSNRPGSLNIQLRQRLFSWSGHVLSWTEAPGLHVYVMRYEDMKHSPLETFTAAVDFVGLDYSPHRIEKALKFSDISEMQRQEKENGFREKPVKCDVFFRKGDTGSWKELLSPLQVQTVLEDHYDMMQRFGYLDDNGEPV
ncbi:MAG: sulfotransferase domain-containing protein [bacterium]|nr:sulfotransferase domain-containing protein [bacterium]